MKRINFGLCFGWFRVAVCCLTLAFAMVSCNKDGEPDNKETKEYALFMYFPWSSNLTSYFYRNIEDMETAISKSGLEDQYVVVFISTSATKAELFEITCADGVCSRRLLEEYENVPFTTAQGIAGILEDVKRHAPANAYSMTIGCHGMGWLPAQRAKSAFRTGEQQKMHWDYGGCPLTRYFGGTKPEYQTDVSTLAEGIAEAGLTMQYILFDDCYMSSVEVAYDLRHVTRFVAGCPTEIMAYGMPYSVIGGHLLGEPDFQAVCDGFHSFYSSYSTPCGTFAVTDCAELEPLAAVMKKINGRCEFDESRRAGLQRMDGYSPVVFYDYGDYVDALCDDSGLLQEFNGLLSLAVPYKTHTPTFYSMGMGETYIRAYSGITTSDPSVNAMAAAKTETSWYRATH